MYSSDECRFQLFRADGRTWIYRRAGERTAPCCVQEIIPFGGGSEMVWGGISGQHRDNVLFNDSLNTFYLRLYGVRHMVKDHSDSEKGNPLPPHRLFLSINSKGSFMCTIPQTG